MTEIDTSLASFEAATAKVRSAGTASKYAGAVRFFLEALESWEIFALEDIPETVLSKYTLKLCQDGYAPQTVHLHIAAARRYVRWLREQGAQVPVLLPPDMPRVTTRLGKALPPHVLERYNDLAGHLLEEPYRTAVQLMPWVGLRGAELVSLQLSALSLRAVTLRGGERKESFVLQLIGKGGDERLVPVLEEGRVILTEYLSGWRRYQRGQWLFPRPPTGRRHVADRTIRHALSKLCEPLGIDFSPHTLRRTYLVCLWRRGVDATVIARIAGHKSIQTTYKHYLALDDEDLLRNWHGESRGQHG